MITPTMPATTPAMITTVQKLRWIPGSSVLPTEPKWIVRCEKSPEPNQPSVYAPSAKKAT